MNDSVLSCSQLSKSFKEAGNTIEVLKEIDFNIQANQTTAILGASGSGKSTFLHLLSGLDHPTSGQIFWQNYNINTLAERKKCFLRNTKLGFIYQFHHLLPEFSALENVAMPLLIQGLNLSDIEEKAAFVLNQVGLTNRKTHRPGQLSGGERQRVAIARALVTEPVCVLADEPTGNLDQRTAKGVFDVMLSLQETLKTSFIIVTHNEELAQHLEQYYYLEDGKLQ